MSFKEINETLGRYNLSNKISKREIKKLAKIDKLSVIQFVDPVTDNSIWKNIETYLLSERPDIELRVFGHYGKECDLSFLQYLPSTKNFSADCLMECNNVENIALLENLEILRLGIFNLTSFEFLNDISPKLKSLFIGQTRSKKPNISVISRFKDLEYVYIEGQNKGIEAISELGNLEKIVLRSISSENINYLKGLKKLWSVDIKLGGIKDFSALTEMRGIKYLELWQVRKLSDIGFISKLTDLQYLFLQSLPNIEKVPDLSANEKLRRIYFENMKGLKNVDSLKYAKCLEEFICVDCSNLQPEDLIPVLKNKTLKSVLTGFGSDMRNRKFEEYMNEYGKTRYNRTNFEYL
ncbi:leucine-rich repeat domain-containing protein [Mangrovibacterium diazotrophicum]|uniref:Leucine rich repeat (LRR) protein n=1 Tax=Mangrovibacterium diazotrophicum TaxID=1261403 RepID=A0A419VWM5_9BACT|nr:hypothetical protein [Mangrovibacterium diazotrophicum]RKD86554.1 hypothetical protein BC643_4252 [Mangrovibacterium diazotrophicum]